MAHTENKVGLILEEFDKAKNKTQFIKHMAEKFNRSAQGIKNNWFYGFNTFPKELQDDILKESKKYNKKQTA